MPLRIQKITWGAGFANTLLPRLPFHRMMPKAKWVGETGEAESGVIDAWREGHHQELTFEARYLPPHTDGSYTGWYGATGWKAFLSAARDGDTFRLYLDKDEVDYHTCQAVPDSVEEEREDSKAQYYRFRMTARDTGGNEFEV